MSQSKAPFRTAAVPMTFVPRAFDDNLHAMFHDFDEAQTDFQTYLSDINAAPFEPRVAGYQRRLSLLYDDFSTAARKSVLFVAYCMKNIALMDGATARLKKRISDELGMHARVFADPSHLEREFIFFRDQTLSGARTLYPIFNEDTRAQRHAMRFRGDPYRAVFLMRDPLLAQVFNDWVEYNFLRAFKLPLGLFECSPEVRARIEREIATRTYGEKILSLLRDKQLHGRFPGLSLDADPHTPSQLQKVREGIAENAFYKPDITARIIEVRDAAGRAGSTANRTFRGRAPRGPAG